MSAPGLVIMVTRNKLRDTHKTEERNSNHCSILAWRILWTEEPGKVQLVGSQSQTRLSGSHTHTHTHVCTHLGPASGMHSTGVISGYYYLAS